MKYFPVKGGIYDKIIPTKIMTGEIIYLKNISVYRMDNTVKYMRNTILAISINYVPKVPYAWNQAEIYKAGSSL